MRYYNFKYEQKLIILVGNIGSGKSTYVKSKEEEYVVISRDKTRYMLGNGNYVFITELEAAIWAAENALFENLLDTKINIIVDETNMCDESRARYIDKAKEAGYEVSIASFPKLSKEESVQRRISNNHGEFTKGIWEDVWQNFDNKYVEPSFKEDVDYLIQVDNKDFKVKETILARS